MRDNMSKKLFITGTGTDVGKTYISGLIIKKLNEAGKSAAYYKAAMSGNVRDEKGLLIPGDAKFVRDMSGIKQTLDSMCPYVYETAVSPHLASQIEGNPVEMNVVMSGLNKVLAEYDYITAEGSGGILCPLRFNDGELNLTDFVKEGKFSSVIVADAGLGTVNDVALTAYYMQKEGFKINGIIFNNYEEGNFLHDDNLFMCESITGIPVLACVKRGAVDLNISIERLLSLYE